MSTLRVNTIQNSGGTGSPEINGLARAWVNFNGTGTVAIRASNNVSSITDNGTGDYTVNFTTSMPDTNYSVAGVVKEFDGATASSVWLQPALGTIATVYTTGSFRVLCRFSGGNADSAVVNVNIFR
jgi:hypothetical protein